MAIDWGAWEGASPNRLRIGIEVDWEAITHGETEATATIDIHLDAEGSWSDTQTITFGGSISGSVTFSNNQSNNSVKRATKTYDYTYGGSSYGSSPGSRTFTASLSGAFNGATPSNSVSSNIPARPYAAPAAPTNAATSRISDTSTKITWTNKDTAGEPWDNVWLDRSINGGAWSRVSSSIAGSATSYTHGTAANTKYRFRVAADNTIATSAWDETGDIYTSPLIPGAPTRTEQAGPLQRITWSNSGIGYSEYVTEIIGYKNGVSVGVLGTVSTGVATFDHTTSNPVSVYTTGDKWKYTVRHKTSVGTALYSSETAFTSETAGVTAPPLAPTGLTPNGLTIDPTLSQRLSWVFAPGIGGDTQTAFTVRHRLAGTTTWTEATGTTSQFYDLPANTYQEQAIVEWTVATKGSDPLYGPYADTVQFLTAITAIAPDPVKLPVVMDLFTGDLEASTTAYELRNYIMRAQSQLMGGGIRAVSASYGLTWSQRFIQIGLGRSSSTFINGHHDILNPYGWSVTFKEVASNVAKLTVSASTVRARVGDTITVQSVGAPFDGTFVVRESGSNYIKYDLVNANITNTAATGGVYCTIKGHGGVADSVPTSGVVTLATWESLWYELPFGWGAGTTAKKNGVVTVTNKALTSNVATLTVVKPHYFAIGDRVTVSIGDATFDGPDFAITAMTDSTISYAKTASNVSSQAATGQVRPSGKDTFFGNFHKTYYTSDFVVPDNWILLAMRNGDGATVEWGTGDAVDPGFDSDSPVLKQVILNSGTDATPSAGNKPALRIGSITGVHLRIDGNEIIAMNSDSAQGSLSLNAGGGASANNFTVNGNLDGPNYPTTTAAANANLNTGTNNRLRLVTSLSRFKMKQKEISLKAAQGLLRVTPKSWFDKAEVDEKGGSTKGLRRHVGLVAEDVQENAPEWATYNPQTGELNGVAYDRLAAGLLVLVQDLYDQNDALRARLDALEAN